MRAALYGEDDIKKAMKLFWKLGLRRTSKKGAAAMSQLAGIFEGEVNSSVEKASPRVEMPSPVSRQPNRWSSAVRAEICGTHSGRRHLGGVRRRMQQQLPRQSLDG